MPLILESVYGSEIWTWFDNDARERLQGYKWAAATGLTAANEDEYDDAMDAWNKYEFLEDNEISMIPADTNKSFDFSFDLDNEITGKSGDNDIDANSHGSRTSFWSTAHKDPINSTDEDDQTKMASSMATIFTLFKRDADLRKAFLTHLNLSSDLQLTLPPLDNMIIDQSNTVINANNITPTTPNNDALVQETPGDKK